MKPGIFIRILSFIWPVILKKYSSFDNPILEITLYHNKLLLNTKNANYSFGSLHRVMEIALKLAKNEFDAKMENVLLLGYGGGSAAEILRKKWNPEANITAVEIDPVVIGIAKEWFPRSEINFVAMDAREFLSGELAKFDLIICDVFIDVITPDYFLSNEFYQKVGQWLSADGVFAQNLMMADEGVLAQFELVKMHFRDALFVNVVETNRIFLGKAL